MKKLLLSAVFLLTASMGWAVPNNYMVENTSGTDTTGNFCYDFQTRPTCSARITNLTTVISSGSISPGSTNYIQNTASPTTATQVYSVLNATVTNNFNVGQNAVVGAQVSANNFNSTGSTPPNNGWTTSAANTVTFYTATTPVMVLTSTQSVTILNSLTVPTLIASSGTITNFNATASTITRINSTTIVVTTITPTNLIGTTTNNNATLGSVGEYIEGVNNTIIGLGASDTYINCSTVTLTAGDWDLTFTGVYILNGAVVTEIRSGISVDITANSFSDASNTQNLSILTSSFTNQTRSYVPAYRVSIASTTPYYAKMRATYTGGPPQTQCLISARRMR